MFPEYGAERARQRIWKPLYHLANRPRKTILDIVNQASSQALRLRLGQHPVIANTGWPQTLL